MAKVVVFQITMLRLRLMTIGGVQREVGRGSTHQGGRFVEVGLGNQGFSRI